MRTFLGNLDGFTLSYSLGAAHVHKKVSQSPVRPYGHGLPKMYAFTHVKADSGGCGLITRLV